MDYVRMYCEGEYVDVPTKTYGMKVYLYGDMDRSEAIGVARSKIVEDLEKQGYSALLNTFRWDIKQELMKVRVPYGYELRLVDVAFIKVKAFEVPPKDRKYKG